ncbi:hypothetical protein GCM10008910_26980 [Faecalicatena orotica]|uniref:Uncharacterized protein n=1 Tax=Faecalicatena orotica TaxID=1544 RepID=A0A2Y9BL54_9FIRM|nr:hypothetical protein A8806_11859 [Faecalicatena orotica]SSA58273.1 hypothetical protein SAMN05216536_11859 [Faecalicatena orotica]
MQIYRKRESAKQRALMFRHNGVSKMFFTIVSVTTFNWNDQELFGYKAFIVRSDSMSVMDYVAFNLISCEGREYCHITGGIPINSNQ